MKVTQLDANKDFSQRIQKGFKSWCAKKGKKPTQENLIKYMVRHGFVLERIINRYLSLALYKEELPKTATDRWKVGRRIIAVQNIEDRVPLHETQIKSNINNHATAFRDRMKRFPF